MEAPTTNDLTDEEFEKLDTIDQLCELLRRSGATICFCTVCNHKDEYGYCWFCRCHNGVKKVPPLDAEGLKVKAALDQTLEVAKNLHRDLEELKGKTRC